MTKASEKVDTKMKQMVEEAGCPYFDIKQMLERNVCLMPYYRSNELPNPNGITNVVIYLYNFRVLEVDEKKNTITVKVTQGIHWWESRIRANFSTVSKQNGLINISPENFREIWNPDTDMYTQNLQEWKSQYDPRLFLLVAVSSHNSRYKWIPLHNYQLHENETSIIAVKAWRATLFCNFDFSSFPFDTQRCAFLQLKILGTLHLLSHALQNTELWRHKAAGFDINITQVGTLVNYNVTLQNATGATGFNITLERVVRPYLYQYYFPCIAIVVVSQISFIIPLSAIPGRVALVVTQFLTLTNIFIHQMVRRICTIYIIICIIIVQIINYIYIYYIYIYNP